MTPDEQAVWNLPDDEWIRHPSNASGYPRLMSCFTCGKTLRWFDVDGNPPNYCDEHWAAAEQAMRDRVAAAKPSAPWPISGKGALAFCPACYPMLGRSDTGPILKGHYRRGFVNSRHLAVFERGARLRFVEEAVALDGVPGLLLREFVTDDAERLTLCSRNGHREPMVSLRYAPHAEIVHEYV